MLIITIVPRFCSFMCGTISCVSVIVPNTLVSNTARQPSEIGVLDGLRKRAVHERAVHECVDSAEALDRLRRELPALRALGDGGTPPSARRMRRRQWTAGARSRSHVIRHRM